MDKRIEAILGTLIGNSVQRQGSVGVQQQIAGAHGVDNRDPGGDNRDPGGDNRDPGVITGTLG